MQDEDDLGTATASRLATAAATHQTNSPGPDLGPILLCMPCNALQPSWLRKDLPETVGSSLTAGPPARSGNTKPKRASFLSAFASLHDPNSRAYYDRQRAEGKKHNVALICLARRRCAVLYAMLKNHEFYREPATSAA